MTAAPEDALHQAVHTVIREAARWTGTPPQATQAPAELKPVLETLRGLQRAYEAQAPYPQLRAAAVRLSTQLPVSTAELSAEASLLAAAIEDLREALYGGYRPASRPTAAVRGHTGQPLDRDAYTAYLREHLSGDVEDTPRQRHALLAPSEAQVVCWLLEELAGVYHGEELGALAHEIAARLEERLGRESRRGHS